MSKKINRTARFYFLLEIFLYVIIAAMIILIAAI